MTLNDLMPELRALLRTDKLWVIQIMAVEVAREEKPWSAQGRPGISDLVAI